MKTRMGWGYRASRFYKKIKNSENATDDTEFLYADFPKNQF